MKIKSFFESSTRTNRFNASRKSQDSHCQIKRHRCEFTSTISDLSQHHQMMTNWYNNLKKNWPKLHDSTNSDGNGHCLIIKRDENDPGVEIGFWLGEDNATAFILTAIFIFSPQNRRNFSNHLHDSKEKHIFAT